MSLGKKKINELMSQYGKSEKDSGATEVQIAILTDKITYMTDHLKLHKRDYHSRRGLLKMVGKRKRLLKYLERTNIERFRSLKTELRIR